MYYSPLCGLRLDISIILECLQTKKKSQAVVNYVGNNLQHWRKKQTKNNDEESPWCSCCPRGSFLMQICTVASWSEDACMLHVQDQHDKTPLCVCLHAPTGCDYCLPQRDAYCRYCG